VFDFREIQQTFPSITEIRSVVELIQTIRSTKGIFSRTNVAGSCDELIIRPRSPADCPRSSNRNETESFMEATKAQNWAVES
jgi:hypothetical protein